MAVRDLEFLAWRNNLAWLEKKGDRWNAAVKSENQRFRWALRKVKPIKPLRIQHSISKKGWKVHEDDYNPLETWTNGTLSVTNVSSADIANDLFAASIQDPDGYERFTLKIYRDNVEIFSLEKIGPTVFFSEDKLIYLGSSKDLRYDSVMSLSLSSYTATIIYTVNNAGPRLNLELNIAEDGSVYVTEGDFVDVRFGFVNNNTIQWHPKKVSSVFVVDRNTYILNGRDNIESASTKGSWTITRSHGIRTLNHKSQSVTVWGEIYTRGPMELYVCDVRYEPYTIRIANDTLLVSNPKPFPYRCSYYRDLAPCFVVHPNTKPRGLLVTAYGAYGIRTKIGNLILRWKALLDRGWIIASVAVPGGGDHDDAWKKAGQRLNRLHSIEVFTKTIKRLQEEHSISPKATALYGRSAGGMLVIATGHHTPGLVGAIYTESPYVDALRTISNPKLPLTAIETREFGTDTLTDILATAAWSPMEHISPAKSSNSIFAICRTDQNDLEVLPYEPMKWIMRLRSAGHKALLYIHKGRGHFTTTAETRAEDLSLLDDWLKSFDMRNKNRSYKYKMSGVSMRNKSKSKTNKNKSGGRRDKNKNKNKTSKNKSGGRRNKTSRKH